MPYRMDADTLDASDAFARPPQMTGAISNACKHSLI
jgi:hypothetical protein